MKKLREQLEEFKSIYILNKSREITMRDHSIKTFDEFAGKCGYKTSENYSRVTFVRLMNQVFNLGQTDTFSSVETLQTVGPEAFTKRMGISAKIFRNIGWKDPSLSENCINGYDFLDSYKKSGPDLDKVPNKKRTQYVHEIIPFEELSKAKGAHEYINLMDKINYNEESFSSNKNLFFQNHIIIHQNHRLESKLESKIKQLRSELKRRDEHILCLESRIQNIESKLDLLLQKIDK